MLNQQDYQAMRTYLARKENITNESDVSDILLQAGYTLPARLPEEEAAKKRSNKDHVAFALSLFAKGGKLHLGQLKLITVLAQMILLPL